MAHGAGGAGSDVAFVVQSRGREVRLGSRAVADELTRELAFEHGSALMTSGGAPILRCRRLGKKVTCLTGQAALDGARPRRRRKRRR